MGKSRSHDLGHCECTAKISLNEPLRDTAVTFFGKIQNVPINYIMGTSQSCDLGHCECPGCSPGQGNCRKTGRENSECTWDGLGGYIPGTLSISLQCTCSVPAQYTGPCPQWLLLLLSWLGICRLKRRMELHPQSYEAGTKQ